MGMSAAIVAGGYLAYKSMTKQPTVPTVTPPTIKDPTEAGDLAGQRQRRRMAGASGRSDTILTGPQGLGDIAPGQASVKTLLGM